jgi:membrane protease YdiL (CAAX protease family)
MLVAIPLVDLLGLLNQKIHFGGSVHNWMKAREEEAASQVQFLAARHTVKELLLNLFFIAVLAGVGEELFFRGVLQRLLIRMTKSPWAGIVVTAFLFSAFHLQFFGFFPRFVLGILLGVMYWYSGSLWVSILAHFFYDALIITIIYANPDMAKDPNAALFKASIIAIPALISALLLAVLIRYMKQRSQTRYDDVYKNDFSSPDQFSF